MKKKIRMILLVMTAMALFITIPAFSIAAPVTWADDFVYEQDPTPKQCQAWHDFLSRLEPDIEFVSVTMSGTLAPEGVSITDPAAAQELAWLLYTRTPGEVDSGGHLWSVGLGCNLSSCVLSGEGVELRIDQPGGCVCDEEPDGFVIRPDIGVYNWGGVNSVTCLGPDQTMMVEFQVMSEETVPEMSPTIMVGECDSGVDNILLAESYSVNDQIAECDANAKNHGSFVKCVSNLLNILKKEGLISGQDKGAIQSCAASAGE